MPLNTRRYSNGISTSFFIVIIEAPSCADLLNKMRKDIIKYSISDKYIKISIPIISTLTYIKRTYLTRIIVNNNKKTTFAANNLKTGAGMTKIIPTRYVCSG